MKIYHKITIPRLISKDSRSNPDMSPLVLTASITLAASCAFMLPVATPPNLIVYGSNLFKVNQMIKAGFALNILGLILVTLIALTLVPYFLG